MDTTPTREEFKRERARKQRCKTAPVYAKWRDKIKAMAAHRTKHPRATVKYWLTDTGCGYDLASRKVVAKMEARIKKSGSPLVFSTANGSTEAIDDILLHVSGLDEDIEPYVLTSTPAVLSIGRRCMDFGYEFRWPAGKLPYFITPGGVKVSLVVEDYVPYLRTSLASRAKCAVSSLRRGRGAGAQNINTNDGINQHPTANPSRVKREPKVKDEPEDDPVVVVVPDIPPPGRTLTARTTLLTWRMSPS